MFREVLHLGLCLWESNLFMVLLLAHSFWHTNTHAYMFFSGWWWNKSCFRWWQEGPKGGGMCFTQVSFTHSHYIYMHTNFPTLTVFCLRACVQYLSLFLPPTFWLFVSGSLLLSHLTLSLRHDKNHNIVMTSPPPPTFPHHLHHAPSSLHLSAAWMNLG